MSDNKYGDAIKELEEIVQQLERGGKNLDETLVLFQRGAELLEVCQAELATAEGKLVELRLKDAQQGE